MNLNGIDIMVLLVVGGSALLGIKRGFVTEVLALFAWAAMVFALKIFHLPLSKILAGTIGTPSGAAVLEIAAIVADTLERYDPPAPETLDAVLDIDREARAIAEERVKERVA